MRSTTQVTKNGADRYACKYSTPGRRVLQLDSTSEGDDPSADSLFFLMPKTVLSKVFIVDGCFFRSTPSEMISGLKNQICDGVSRFLQRHVLTQGMQVAYETVKQGRLTIIHQFLTFR